MPPRGLLLLLIAAMLHDAGKGAVVEAAVAIDRGASQYTINLERKGQQIIIEKIGCAEILEQLFNWQQQLRDAEKNSNNDNSKKRMKI